MYLSIDNSRHVTHSRINESTNFVPCSPEPPFLPLSVTFWLIFTTTFDGTLIKLFYRRLIAMVNIGIKSRVLGISIRAKFGNFVSISRVIRSPFSISTRNFYIINFCSEPNTAVLYLNLKLKKINDLVRLRLDTPATPNMYSSQLGLDKHNTAI